MRVLIISLMLLLPHAVFCNNFGLVVPKPKHEVQNRGEFKLTPSTVIYIDSKCDSISSVASMFNSMIGTSLSITNTKPQSNYIECRINSNINSNEGYKLTVKRNSILVEGGGVVGIFYGLQTLRQLTPAKIESGDDITISCCKIEDTPYFSYRGLLVDVARHFMSKEYMFKVIDMMAMHKLNTLHWHLTDNQGWRIEIKGYPKLTEVGAYRDRTLVGHSLDKSKPYQWDNIHYGGFYTQDDIKEIVEYAKKRFITIIPEIDMPAHALAALAAYPEYSCSGGPFEIVGIWRPFNDIICTSDSAFKFIEGILDEVIELFPSKYIHIGGDEVPKMRWDRCYTCQENIKRLGLDNSDELQLYFTKRVASYLNSKGREVVGWDELMTEDTPQSVMIMSWRDGDEARLAAKNGNRVVMSSFQSMYLDFAQRDVMDEPMSQGLISGRVTTVETCYNFIPYPTGLTDTEKESIIGVEACLWSEYVPTESHADYMLFPRLAAVAEVGWCNPSTKDYDAFIPRLNSIVEFYKELGVNYCKGYLNF